MTVFADSSAVVKIYADEVASSKVRSLAAMYIADTTRVEVPAALWRKTRMGELDRWAGARLVQWFEDDVDLATGSLVPIEIDRETLTRAAHLTETHALRAYDAVQLAAALRVVDIDPTCTTFATFDGELRTAAVREGFEPLV